MESAKRTSNKKRPYTSPQMTRWGTVVDLTRLGLTNPGHDSYIGNSPHENGSILSRGRPFGNR